MTKRLWASALYCMMAATAFAQWTPATLQGKQTHKNVNIQKTYALDLQKMKALLANAPIEAKDTRPVEIQLPDLQGKLHRFAVYSRPVADRKLAERYGLGSYVGRGIDDPSLYVRFSFSGNDFQSMLMQNGEYQFIEPLNNTKSVYGVFSKTKRTSNGKPFECTTSESPSKQKELNQLFDNNKLISKLSDFTITSSDKKFRTYRLALAVTGEYTQRFGGVAGALTQINATMTRVNGIFEKDLAVNLILIGDNDKLVYSNPNTDPFSSSNSYSMELQRTLTKEIGEANYDLGHVFGNEGGGGNAGCNGCVCISPDLDVNGIPISLGKGSAYTTPYPGSVPYGDVFDVNLVAHEMGHQLGANHTFSHVLHAGSQYKVHMEPNLGVTIMSYGTESGYFHTASVDEILTNLKTKNNCGTVIPINNNSPYITPMPDVTIPKSTAFLLKAEAIDPEGDALTYTWEQVDRATIPVNQIYADNTTGPMFRSVKPSNSPERSFPKLTSVLSGALTADWETVSNVARDLNFRVTVRDNNPTFNQQQLATATQKVIVTDTEPFRVTSSIVYNNAPTEVTWLVSGTDKAPFNAINVKIDYTADNGQTWVTVSESTPNDGSEKVTFPSSLVKDSQISIRVSAIGNVFFAVNKATVSQISACNGEAPKNVNVSGIATDKVFVNWNLVTDATYKIRYRNPWENAWNEVTTTTSPYEIKNLQEGSLYEVQVATVCNSTTGAYSESYQFFTAKTSDYCELRPSTAVDEWIYNVTITPEGNNIPIMNSDSQASPSSSIADYVKDASRLVTLVKGSTNNTISVKKGWTYNLAPNMRVSAWIDFNGDGVYSESEKIMMTDWNKDAVNTISFNVPQDAYTGNKLVGMRVATANGFGNHLSDPCVSYTYGEVENYSVKILPSDNFLSIGNESPKAESIGIYPNPAADWLNMSNNISTNADYTVYNTVGQIMSQGKIMDRKINISRLKKGTYILSITENNVTTANLKFIKK